MTKPDVSRLIPGVLVRMIGNAYWRDRLGEIHDSTTGPFRVSERDARMLEEVHPVLGAMIERVPE